MSDDLAAETPGPTVLSMPATIDLAASPDILEELEYAIDRTPWVILDMSAVTFLDSTGLGALVWAHKRAVERAGGVALVALEGPAARVLSISGLDAVLPTFATVAELGPVPWTAAEAPTPEPL